MGRLPQNPLTKFPLISQIYQHSSYFGHISRIEFIWREPVSEVCGLFCRILKWLISAFVTVFSSLLNLQITEDTTLFISVFPVVLVTGLCIW